MNDRKGIRMTWQATVERFAIVIPAHDDTTVEEIRLAIADGRIEPGDGLEDDGLPPLSDGYIWNGDGEPLAYYDIESETTTDEGGYVVEAVADCAPKVPDDHEDFPLAIEIDGVTTTATPTEFEAFERTYIRLADKGHCDNFGGAESERVWKQWLECGKPADVAGFIADLANAAPEIMAQGGDCWAKTLAKWSGGPRQSKGGA